MFKKKRKSTDEKAQTVFQYSSLGYKKKGGGRVEERQRGGMEHLRPSTKTSVEGLKC